MSPPASVMILSENAERHPSKILYSLMAQTRPDNQMIGSNLFSTDGADAFLSKFQESRSGRSWAI
jgi:hypothetical protein